MGKQGSAQGVKAVFFDVGNTLLHDDPSVPYVFTRVAKRLGHEVALEDAKACMPEVDAFYQREYLRDGDFWCVHDRAVQLWLDMYAMMAQACGVTHQVPELCQAVYDEYLLPENWSCFPDVLPCLKVLKSAGLKLGIISNWDATLEGLIRSIGLLPYFDTVVASAAVGCRKPGSAIFEIALERIGESAHEAVHVGDLPEADGDGASSAGIRPVIIDRNERWQECAYDRMASLTELPVLLGI